MTSAIYAKEWNLSRYSTKSSQGGTISTYCKDKVKLKVLQFLGWDWYCIIDYEGEHRVDLDLPPAEQSCDLDGCTVSFTIPYLRDYRYIADIR